MAWTSDTSISKTAKIIFSGCSRTLTIKNAVDEITQDALNGANNSMKTVIGSTGAKSVYHDTINRTTYTNE